MLEILYECSDGPTVFIHVTYGRYYLYMIVGYYSPIPDGRNISKFVSSEGQFLN